MDTRDTSLQAKWESCLAILANHIEEREFQTWFRPIKFVSFNKETEEIVLQVPNDYFAEILSERFKKITYAALWKAFNCKIRRISYVSPKVSENKEQQTTNKPSRSRQESHEEQLNSQLNADYRFDNFIEGESNKLPRSVGLSIAENPQQKTFNPLFIYGSPGVGKTHLINAIGTRIKELYPQQRVLYVGAHQFTIQYTDSIRQNTRNDFLHFYQTIDVLIIDDIQEWAGQEKTQLAFFHIINHLKMNGKQIILTSDKAPSAMKGMEERLLSRFKSGLAAELEKPNSELCYKILESKISQDDLQIPEEVVAYIAQNVNNSVRDLEGILNSLIAYSIVHGRNIDLPMVEQVVQKVVKFQTREATMDEIISVTCDQCHVTQEEIFSKSRKANIVTARQIAMYMAQQLTKLTSSRIGLLIGGRNHATVLHAIKQVRDRMATDTNFCTFVKEIEHTLKSMA